MRQRIFISYRRQDSAANAVGISQYLENEFGRKNVYIDVDTLAGAKYPTVIEKRLAECRVLLVLIGPDWLKLQKPNDWVQREIAYALKRDITVIPVLINGAQLPDKELLPDDIQGLLDHQAASVSVAGFRHEMAGLVRDIRSIKTPKPWRLYGVIAAVLILSLFAGILVHGFGFHNLLERTRTLVSSSGTATTTQKGVWKSQPGEWIMYAIDKNPIAYLLDPSSIKLFGDNVAFKNRYPVQGSSEKSSTQGVYEENRVVLSCKSDFAIAERTVYNNAGEIVFHFKFGEPESLSNSQPIPSGSVLAVSESILCDKQLRTLLLSKARFGDVHLSYLANAPAGDGTIFHGPINPTSNPAYPFEVLLVDKKDGDHTFADVFPGQNVRGLPPGYRTVAQNVQIDCAGKKLLSPTLRYYDGDNKLAYLATQTPVQPLDVKVGSIFGLLQDIACGASGFNVAGNYEGMNKASYGKAGQGEQKISIAVQQTGSDLKLSFKTANDTQGEGVGKLTGNRVESISLRSTTPNCPGSYSGSLTFADNSIAWSYKGTDCGGDMEGHGTAKKVSR
jgi:hypothetical protein